MSYSSCDLYEIHRFGNLADQPDLCFVDVPVRKMLKQVTESKNGELFL
jgi:hypothetical protein